MGSMRANIDSIAVLSTRRTSLSESGGAVISGGSLDWRFSHPFPQSRTQNSFALGNQTVFVGLLTPFLLVGRP